MKNKGRLLISIGLLLIVILLISVYIILITITDKKANEFLYALKKYEFDLEELTTGQYYDFSKQNNDITDVNIVEGIIFKEVDGDIKIISNIKINGMYCKLEEGKFESSIFNKKGTNVESIGEYDEYEIGEAVVLNNNLKCHVINSSSKYSAYVTVILDERVDINGDGFTMGTSDTGDPDRIPFDISGNKEYDVNSKSNIGYYIENTYKKSLTSFSNIFEIRLLTTNEYEKIVEVANISSLTEEQKSSMFETENQVLNSINWMEESNRPYSKLGKIKITDSQYAKLMPNWLYNSFSGNFWIIDSDNDKATTVVWSGDGYVSVKTTTGYSLKPIITLSKDNIKK